jgi:Rrf2 family protein
MIQFSRTLLMALESLGYIGRKVNDSPIPLKDVALVVKASPTYLSKVLQQLTRAGFLSTVMGPHGGYKLSRKPREIPLLDVVELFAKPMETPPEPQSWERSIGIVEILHWCSEPSRERMARLTVEDLSKAMRVD